MRKNGRSKKLINLAISFSFLLSLGATVATTKNENIVKADASSMAEAPGATSSNNISMSGEYVFAPKVSQGLTKTWAFGSSAKWLMGTDGNYALKYDDPGSIADKGKMGVYYQNVGVYKGHTVDARLTITDYKSDDYKTLDNMDNADRSVMTIYSKKVALDIPASNIGTSVKYKLDYLDSKTKKPLEISGQYSFNDIDPNQGIFLDPATTKKINNLYYTKDTVLSYADVNGQDLIYNRHFDGEKGTDSDKNEDETWLRHNFTIAYNNASSMTFTWGFPYTGTGSSKQNAEKFPDRDFHIDGMDKAFWKKSEYSSDLSGSLKVANPEDDKKNIDEQVVIRNGGSYLEMSAMAILPEKPAKPSKYVSDSDEGTNEVDEVGLSKSVSHDILKDRYEKYHYQIVHSVPDVQDIFKYKSYEISDDIDEVLNTSNVKVYNQENQDVTYRFTVVNSDNKLKVVAKPSTLSENDFYHETYKVLFDAEVKPGASLAKYKDSEHPDQALIENTPKVTIDDDTEKGNTTKTNIPFTHPDPTKAVSVDGKGSADSLNIDFDKEYKYNISATAPDNTELDSLEISDKLEPVQDIKEVKVYDADNDNKDITDEGKLTNSDHSVSWVAKDPTKWHGKHLHMVITATVKDSEDLLKYLDKDSGKIEIPNTAHLKFNNEDKTTNKTHVTPNTPKASVVKKIEVNN